MWVGCQLKSDSLVEGEGELKGLPPNKEEMSSYTLPVLFKGPLPFATFSHATNYREVFLVV